MPGVRASKRKCKRTRRGLAKPLRKLKRRLLWSKLKKRSRKPLWLIRGNHRRNLENRKEPSL